MQNQDFCFGFVFPVLISLYLCLASPIHQSSNRSLTGTWQFPQTTPVVGALSLSVCLSNGNKGILCPFMRKGSNASMICPSLDHLFNKGGFEISQQQSCFNSFQLCVTGNLETKYFAYLDFLNISCLGKMIYMRNYTEQLSLLIFMIKEILPQKVLVTPLLL